MLCGNLLHSMSGASEFSSFFSDERRVSVLRSVFSSYYFDAKEESTVFDTNRTWTSKTSLLNELYPDAKIICCVRSIPWIIDSIEKITRQNSLQPSKIFNYKTGGSVYSRVQTLMEPETGIIGTAWNSLREAWFSDNADQIIFVIYDRLVKSPEQIMRKLYFALDEEYFNHDFGNVFYDEPVYDAQLGLPGLHRVRQKVEIQNRKSCLPPDLFAKYAKADFWTNRDINIRNVHIL